MSTSTPLSGRWPSTFAPGAERSLTPSELEREIGPVPPTVDRGEFTHAYLVHHGLEALPAARDAGDEGDDAAVAEPAPDAPVRIRLTPRYALQGAALVTVGLALLAYLGRPIYGVIVLAFGALGGGLLYLLWDRVASRSPGPLPRGRALGAAAILPFLLVAALIDVGLRQRHIVDLRHQTAAKAVLNANAALDANDVDGAIKNLAYAESTDPNAKGLKTVRARLVISQTSGKIKALRKRIAELEAQLKRERKVKRGR
jgi:hypothetical protein